ncbi:MAG TPA: DUF1254 domain-containing protein [Polyangiaceae bacterium]|nr:DUF1254 domain-containing protein [Polyangiaceae bacterium]
MMWRIRARALAKVCSTLPFVWACGAATPPAETAAPVASPPAAAAVIPSAPSDSPKRATELEALGFDAYLWGFAIVENYKAIYAYNVNTSGPEYKGPFNTLSSAARVYTPADKAVITPNSDTPYGFVTLDLRAEPQLLSVPAVEKGRYYSLQLVDAYTHNFGYVGTRTTGNKPGRYLVTGPTFKGPKPEGVDQVFSAETDFVLVVYRTQLFNPPDIQQVKRIQAGYSVTPLHELTKSAAPLPPPALDFPVWEAETVKGLGFFSILDFLLDLMPVVPEDAGIRQRLLAIGVGAPGKLDPKTFTEGDRTALLAGQQRGQKKLAELSVDTHFLGHEVTAGDLFGNRAYLGADVRRRDVGAMLGIYGNSREEALYPIYRTDADGKPLDASQSAYTLRFEKGKLPPAKAFWSLTMYDGRSKLLVDNPLKRYLINSTMLQSLKRDADGGITLTLQHASPGKAQEANWLPAPNGPFYAVLRLYYPEPAAYDGSWKLPSLVAIPKPAKP